MLKLVTFLALAATQISADNVELLPTAQIAARPPIVTARSSQYFAQNHNALASPLITPFAPLVARTAFLPAPAQLLASAPLALAPAATFISRNAIPVARPAVGQFVAGIPPVSVAPAQSPASFPQQPAAGPLVPAEDSEVIEAARVRALPSARNQQASIQQTPQARVQERQGQNNGLVQQRAQQAQGQEQGKPLARSGDQVGAPVLANAQQFIASPYFAQNFVV